MVQRTAPAIAKCPRSSLLLFAGAALLWATNAFAVAPVAVDDVFSTGNGIAVSDDLSANDSGLDGPTDAYVLDTAPLNGMAVVNTDGTFTYTPNAAYAGTDTFTYTITDGAGGASKAQVKVTVASATDFISAANSVLITPEDTSIPLGLSVAQDLFDGGALQDIVSTDVLFRPANGGLTPLTSMIPAGVSGIVITAFSSQSNNTAGGDKNDDDYQLLNARIDLINRVSSGRLANIVDGRLALLDQYSWSGVDLGQAVLSDPSKVVGFSTGASDPVFSVVGSQLQIVENHTLETAYHIEFTTSVGDSTNFLGAASAVQLDGETESTIDIDAGVEPANGKKGFVILSGNSAAGGSFDFEYKGFSRLVIDFDTGLVSGAIAVIRGETEANTVTYGFEGYPLVDLRNGSATIDDVIAGSASVIGDVTSIPEALDSPKLYIDAAGDLVIERKQGFADNFTTMYTGEAYERTGFGSIASFVDTDADDTLFNTGGGVASDGGPINELHFEVPASAQVGLAQMSWNTVGGNDFNENVGFGFAVIDMDNGTTSGSITFVRATTPDLISWDSVPFNTTIFGATDAAGNPLYQSNKTAGRFTDLYGETAKFTLVNSADGSRQLVFTAENGNGTQAFRQYQGNMQISWLGNEPFEIQGVPVTGSLTPGSPAANGNWEIDFSELPLLEYNPLDDSSDVVDLDFTLSSSGETESIRIYIEPVVDPAVITANDSAGFVNLPFPLSIDVASSTDTDGSESGPDPITLQGVPPSVVLSSSAGTVSNISSGIWEVSVSALATLEAQSPTTVSATVFVLSEQTDENDLDGSGVVDDNGNSVGADEFDVVNFTEVFQLTVSDIPTVVPQVTNLSSPVIMGDAVLLAGESLTVTVNGVSYTNGDGNLVVNANGTWTLTIPAADALVDGTYSVEAEKSLSGGLSAPDITFSELLIDLTPPPAPGVTSQTTQDTTPVISGTTHVGAGVLSVEVNGVVYTEGDGNLVNNGDGTWDLTIPPADLLADNLYQVTAQITDAAGNSAIDSGVDELLVDTSAPPSPGVTSLTTSNDTPTISGTATAGAGETLTVEVNGVVYTAGNGDLVDNGDGTWDLTIPATDVLPEATYDVTATITDIAGNSSADPSSQELTVDLTLPSTPVIISQVTGNTAPIISGLATILTGELLTVEVDGVVYTEGDSFLINNGDGTWDLTIPPGNALADNTYNVTAVVTDAAGNSSSDGTVSELIVDLTATAAPMVVLTADANNDALLNVTEALNPQPVDILLPVAAVAGDTLLWTDTVAPSNKILTAADIAAGLVSTTVALPADGALLTVTSVLVDQVGNSSPSGSDDATVDITTPSAPTIVIVEDANNNSFLIIAESMGPVDVNVMLPADAVAGDELTLTLDGVVSTVVLSVADIGAGVVSVTTPATGTGSTVQVEAFITDPAGNTTPTVNDSAVVDLSAPFIPTVNALTTNNATPTLIGTAAVGPGDVLTVTINGVAYIEGDGFLTHDGAGAWVLVIPASDVLSDGTYEVAVSLMDLAGNTSFDTTVDELIIDTEAPVVPTVISQITNNQLPVISGTATVAAGETLTVDVNGIVYVVGDGSLVDNGDGTWDLTIPASDVLPEAIYNVIASVMDTAGNTAMDTTSAELTIDITATAAPTVILAADVNNNTFLDTTEASNPQPVDIILPATAKVGDTLLWTDTVTPANTVLTAADIAAGVVSTTVALPAEGTVLTVTSVLTDEAGNTSPSSVDSATVDTTPSDPPVPVIVADADNDGLLNIAEALNPQPIDVVLPVTAAVGFTLTVNDGTTVASIVLTAADIAAGVVSVTAALPADGSQLNVLANLEDIAGNVSVNASDFAEVDLTVPDQPPIVITEDASNDGFINIAENVGLVDVSVTLPASAAAGDVLTTNIQDVVTTQVLTAADITAGTLNFTSAAPAQGALVVAEAFLTDPSGNDSSTASDTAQLDISPPVVPTVDSQVINNETPVITGTATVDPNDILRVTVNGVIYVAGNGNLIDNGSGLWSLTIPAADALASATYDVAVEVVDPAGNATIDATTDELIVDLVAPAVPTVNSLLTNLSTPTLNGTAVVGAGESLSVTVNGVVYNEGDGNLSLAANGGWTLNIPANDGLTEGVYEVLVKVTDTAGNLTPDSTSNELVVDLTSTAAPTIILVDDTNNDAFLNTVEALSPQSVSIVLPAGAVVGDTLLWTDGSSPMNTVLTAADIAAAAVSTTVALPADGSVLTVSAVLTDQAGNASPGNNDSATVDTTTPAVPSIVITEDTNNDTFLSLAESNGPVDVTVSLPVDVVAADTLTVVLDGVTSTIVLTTNDVSVGAVNITTPVLANNSSIVAEAFITDIAGNVTAIVNDTVLIDTSAPFIPTAHLLITNNTAPTLTGNAAVGPGDVLTVTVNGVTYIEGDGNLSYNASGSASGNGAWALAIPATDALVDGTYDLSVSLTDPAGNTSVDITTDELVIDTVAPQAPGVTSQTTPDTTPIISGVTPLASGVILSVEVNGVTYTEGDGNLLVNPDGTWDLTIPVIDLLADGLYQVLANTIDLAGNVSIDLGIDELVVDTVLPTTPGVTSLVTNTTVPVIEGVGFVGAGETLTVSVNGIIYTAGDGNLFDNGDGTWMLSIPVANALPEAVYSVIATVTDRAGNSGSDPSSDELTIDLTAPDLPAVVTQLSNLSTPTVLGTALVLSGETLTVTINGVTYVAGDGNLVDNGDETWMLSIPAINALAEATYDVSVNVIDQAGNITQDASMNELKIDLSPTVAPIPVLIADVNDDAFLNVSEAQALQPVTILLPAGAVLGDTLLWSDGITPSNTILNAGDIAAGSYQTSVALPVDGSVLTVTAVIVDLAGNASPTGTDSATVDISSPVSPTIVISEDVNDDSFLNVSELLGAVDVVINLPASAIAGDILVITLDGVTTSKVLSSADIILGAISVTTTASTQGASIFAEAYLVDSAGNASTVSDDVAVVDSSVPFVPSVTSLITNDTTPTITGNAVVGLFDVLQVTVNGITYTDGDGALVNNGDGTWSLTVPATDALADGNYDVVVSLTDLAGNNSVDISLDELVIDTVLPQIPAVTSLTTNDQTPIISGSYTVAVGHTLSVTVNGVNYTQGDGLLSVNADGTWDLQIPNSDILSDGLYQVVAVSTDLAGNTASDLMVDDLLVDTLLPASPGVTSLVTNSGLPVIQGTVTLLPGDVFTVSVNGVSYTLGDGNLVLNGDGTWTLTIPLSDELAEGTYDVVAVVTDSAGNVSTDPSSAELVIDLTAPIAPTVISQASNNPTPVISGSVDLQSGEVFTVTVNGVIYTVGDGNLVVNADGTWELSIPASDALPEGAYNVIATVTDAAGNVISDTTLSELTIDLTAPAAPTFVDALSSSSTPTIGGQVQLEAGDVFTVTVNGVIYTVGDGFLTLDADGNWELMIDPSQPLADGVYDVTLSFEDAAGNLVSNASGQQIIIDTGAPSLTIDDLGVVATYQPTLSGTTNAVDGSIVTIRDANGEIVCEAVVSNGVWECIPSNDLAEGVNDFTAEVADLAGNLIVLNINVTVSADFDGDGIANSLEGLSDSDGDGVPDARDLDSDNDGIPDASEGAIDSDADGVPNYLDGDSDNDGLADILEAEGLDGNSDYSVDNFIDEDNNGLSDELQAVPLNAIDTDFDGVPDYLDVDSDNDGVPDLRESAGEDVDNNGRIDEFVDLDSNGVDDGVQAFPLTIQDTDNDGVPNHLDLNSDNDALSDLVEAIGLDINGDSIVDAMTDADKDGVPDSVDFSIIGGSDADGDDIEDSADVDFVLGDDTDGDGIADEFDPDANGDGYFDGFTDIANLPETDVNDIPELQEAETEAEEFGELRTGRRGFGGCSIDAGAVSSRDPLLLLLTLFAFAGFIRSRRVASGVSRTRSHRASLWVACLVLCTSSLLHSGAVRADHAGDFHKRIYLGAGAGVSYLDPDDSDIPFKLEEQNDASWGGYIGVDLGSRVSLELGYNDLGQAELEEDHFVDYQQTSLSALIYGFNRKSARERRTGFSAFGRLGITRMQNESDIDFVRDNDFSVVVGAGAELAHESGLALRAEATSYDVDANYFGLSLLYRFGHGTHKDNLVKTSPRPAPEIVQPLVDVTQPAPAPTITESVPSPQVEYTVLFDTNSSELNAEAIRMVEEIERQARARTTVNIEITGYADKRGSAEYNLRLSKLRALSVANRLIQRGIVEYRIQVEVGGEVDRFGSMSTRAGRQENRRVQVILLGN